MTLIYTALFPDDSTQWGVVTTPVLDFYEFDFSQGTPEHMFPTPLPCLEYFLHFNNLVSLRPLV